MSCFLDIPGPIVAVACAPNVHQGPGLEDVAVAQDIQLSRCRGHIID